MNNVSIPRGVLVSLVGALVISLVALAFMLGRESARHVEAPAPSPLLALATPTTAPAPAAPAATVPPAPQVARPAAAPPAVTATPAAPPPSVPPPAPRAEATIVSSQSGPRVVAESPPPARHVESPAVDAAMRGQVSSYFQQMDNIQPGGLSGDPQTMAQEILDGAMNGDNAKLDDLVRKAEASSARARGLHPPAPCVHYHQQSLALSAEGVRLLKTMRSAMASGDTTALLGLSARATQMQGQAESLQHEEAAIKSRYGLH